MDDRLPKPPEDYIDKLALRQTALFAAAQRRSGLSEVYEESIARNVIKDAERYLEWLIDASQT